jgi:NDP-sugar pyrophosphorylase family protein
MQCVILAGGLATRLGQITETIPKSMVRIHCRPFLEYQIELLKRNGIRDIVLCVGHLSEKIEQYFEDGSRFDVEIRYSREEKGLLGTGGAVKNAERLLDSEFFLMYGDSYLPIDFAKVLRYFKTRGISACMTVFRNRSLYEKSNVLFKAGIVEVYDKKTWRPEMEYIDYGLIIVTREVLSRIPPGVPFDLADLLSELARHRQLYGYEVYDRFYEIGSIGGLQDFEKCVIEGGRT